jgi:hypothetical protein
MYDYISARNASARAAGASTRLFFGTDAEVKAQKAASHILDRQTAPTATSVLPKGISAGKMTAIVAGVSLAGGALYALSRHKDKQHEPVGPWTARVEEERSAQTSLMQR